MKKIFLLAGLGLSLCSSINSQAQVRLSVQIGRPVTQESWYSNDNDYYYMPEQGVYYNVRRKVYVYPENGAWVTAGRLPDRFGRNYSYRSSKYVRVRDRNPFDRDNDYRQRYGNRNDRHDNGNHNGWNNDHRNDNDHRGNNNDRDNNHHR